MLDEAIPKGLVRDPQHASCFAERALLPLQFDHPTNSPGWSQERLFGQLPGAQSCRAVAHGVQRNADARGPLGLRQPLASHLDPRSSPAFTIAVAAASKRHLPVRLSL